MFASLPILVDPLADISYFANHVLAKIYYKFASQLARHPCKQASTSIRFTISSAGALAHQNDGMPPLCYSNVG